MVDAQVFGVGVLPLPQLLQHLLKLVHFLEPNALIYLVPKGFDPFFELRVLFGLTLLHLCELFAFHLSVLVDEPLIDKRLKLLSHLHQG